MGSAACGCGHALSLFLQVKASSAQLAAVTLAPGAPAAVAPPAASRESTPPSERARHAASAPPGGSSAAPTGAGALEPARSKSVSSLARLSMGKPQPTAAGSAPPPPASSPQRPVPRVEREERDDEPPPRAASAAPARRRSSGKLAAIRPEAPPFLFSDPSFLADGGPTVDYPGSPADALGAGPTSFADLSPEELMEQARHFVCRSCSSIVPRGHKFCGRCGASVPPEITNAQTLFFGDMQNPAKAKLILIRGEGMDGLSFHLKAEQHIVGRQGQLPFDDPFISPRHANFFYRDGNLVVRDENSVNGVYVRVRGTVEVAPGDTFLAGEQVFRLDPTPRASDGQDPDGTYFYSSPKHPSPFRLTQVLQGGSLGMVVCARGSSLQIGREGGDLNFPVDLYMSSSHCRIDEANGHFTLTDLNSRNGTYVRIKGERELSHGDYLFIGRKLLRVEMNSN
jgi:pSer/pThr/pTyr-binding forkhead associated (FHA) protein